MKKNGFTLVEILAVLVLVTAIAIISIPSIINYINSSKNEVSEVTEKLIFTGVDLYLDNNKSQYGDSYLKQYCITLSDVVDAGFLEAPIIDSVSSSEVDLNQFVRISYEYDNNLKKYINNYEISKQCEEVKYICRAVTKDSLTTGNIPTGDYKVGDEYICEVNDGSNYNFFVISSDSDKVNLMLDSHVTSEGKPLKEISSTWDKHLTAWISKEDYGSDTVKNDKGPISAINFLKEATDSWDYINLQTFTFEDDNYEMTFESRARLATTAEMTAKGIGCKEYDPELNLIDGLASCPLWAINYTEETNYNCPSTINNVSVDYSKYSDKTNISDSFAYSYWLMDSSSSDESRANVIGHCGDLDVDSDTMVTQSKGIRPVISIDKSKIKN